MNRTATNYGFLRARLAWRDVTGRRRPVGSREEHLRGAMEWLCRAHDAGGDGGVSRSYVLRYSRAHARIGWLASYPETTGYIIPTFYDYAALAKDDSYRSRAEAMARWEAAVQMPSGAVQGGVIAFAPVPAIFNTGQVLFGWARSHRETGDPLFLEAARKACDFLVEAQDPDGAWRRHGSTFARPGVNLYDARTAWGLLEGFGVTGDSRHRDAVVRNLDYVLSRQRPNGWYEECCLDDNDRPLLHTIAYTMEGLLESGRVLGDTRYVEAARRAADALLGLQRRDGGLAGRFDAEWRPSARWSCVTGDAQTAIVWLRLHEITGERRYLEAARRLNRFVASTQDLVHPDGGVRGGIQGSDPIYGEYGTWEYLNWAAKFYADALLHEIRLSPGDSW